MKPPYRIPSMREIFAGPKNGLRVVSTFSGCGGSCLGYRMAGYEVLWANDFNPNAVASYRANFPSTIHDQRSIRDITADDILAATGLKRGELDLFDGSPPCQSFSSLGKREAKWGKVTQYSDGKIAQRNDDLFFEYARVLEGLQPRAFVAENVSGLARGVAKGYIVEIIAALRACGYKVEVKLLDAKFLGVPQSRTRLIFVGVRNDIGLAPVFPEKLPYVYTVADACPWLAGPAKVIKGSHAFVLTQGLASKQPSSTITCNPSSGGCGLVEGAQHHPQDIGIDDVDRAEVPMSDNLLKKWRGLRIGETHAINFGLTRSSPSKPARCINAMMGQTNGVAQTTPPNLPRVFTVVEVKRLCGFPDDFVLLGSRRERWSRLGNAVVPPMAAAVGRALAEGVLLK